MVDDSKNDRDLVVKFLVKLGFAVMSFASGELALAWLQAQPELPYATLCDLRMNGGMDGFEFGRRFCKLRGGKFVWLIAWTGYVEKVEKDAEKAGYDCCIPKPVTAGNLEAHLRKKLTGFMLP